MHCIGVFFLLVTSIKQLLLMCFCLLLSSILVPQTYISSDHYTCRYEEVCKYNFKNPKSEFDMATGHFTQVVWRDSLVLGAGKAMGKTFHGRPSLFLVARYKPPGNYNGRFKENVRRGYFNPSYCGSKRELF